MVEQLSLWDFPSLHKTKPQVKLIRQPDKGYDVVHILSGKYVCRFQPIFVGKREAQEFCDMLAGVDLDRWWQLGCPDDGTPRRVGQIQMEWRRKTYPGFVWQFRHGVNP